MKSWAHLSLAQALAFFCQPRQSQELLLDVEIVLLEVEGRAKPSQCDRGISSVSSYSCCRAQGTKIAPLVKPRMSVSTGFWPFRVGFH